MWLDADTRHTLGRQLTAHEGGIHELAYPDPIHGWDVPTIGIGHTGPDVVQGMQITRRQALEWFRQDLLIAENDAFGLSMSEQIDLPLIDQIRRAAMVNMSFNLGKGRLSDFRRFWSAVHARDWRKASVEMIDSRWAGQVHQRAFELAYQIRYGRWWAR